MEVGVGYMIYILVCLHVCVSWLISVWGLFRSTGWAGFATKMVTHIIYFYNSTIHTPFQINETLVYKYDSAKMIIDPLYAG